MRINILHPWKMCGRYADDYEATVGGFNETDCMYKLFDLQDNHGELEWYSGFSDADYEAGEYIGGENFDKYIPEIDN